MRRIALFIASVSILCAARPSSQAIADFQITVDRTSNGWQMHCEKGCAWSDLSLTCRDDCRALVDNAGITTRATPTSKSDGFAFLIERTEKGWDASALNGTAWLKLSWGCHSLLPCRAHVDQSGVSGL